MKKKISVLLCLLLGSITSGLTQELPSLYEKPIIDDKGAKPNIIIILDASKHMRDKKDDFDALADSTLLTLNRYYVNSNFAIGRTAKKTFLPPNWRPPQPLEVGNVSIIQYPRPVGHQTMEDFTINRKEKINGVKQMIEEMHIGPYSPFAYSLYDVGLQIRSADHLTYVGTENAWNKYLFAHHKSPIEYRCQAHHILLVAGSHNRVEIYGPVDGVYPFNKYDFPRPDGQGDTSIKHVADGFNYVDLRESHDKIGHKDYDATGKPWLIDGEDPVRIQFSGIAYGADKDTEDYSHQVRGSAEITGGSYARVKEREKLTEGYDKVMRDMTGYPHATNSFEDQVERSSETVIYTSYYDPFTWLGEIQAYGYNEETKEYDNVLWNTVNRLNPNEGKFITFRQGKTVDLTLSNLSNASINEKTLEWLKGVDHEDFVYRRTPLASSIDIDMVYAAKDQLNINLEHLSPDYRKKFIDYMAKDKRKGMPHNLILSGTDDGFINFIIADKSNNERGGQRYSAYFFSKFADQLNEIAHRDFDEHDYKINGQSSLFDALVDGHFKSIGITTLGVGGRGLAGYQLYAPGEKEIKINFEITHRTSGFENLGYTDSKVEFFNRKNNFGKEEAIAVFGNGELKEGGVSSLFFIKADTGELIQEIVLSENGGGASSPALVIGNDKITGMHSLQHIYVGDQSGKLYRVDFSTRPGPGQDNFTDHQVTELFNVGNDRYPITVKPMLVSQQNNIWIYFGTGRAIDKTRDRGEASKVTHYYYGLRDDLSLNKILPSKLLDQEIISVDEESNEIHVSNKRMVPGYDGWRFRLSEGKNDNSGERVTLPGQVFDNRYIHFTTYGIVEGEEGDPCIPDKPFSKLLFLNLYSGSASNAVNGSGSGFVIDDTLFNASTGNALGESSMLGGSGSFSTNTHYIENELLNDLRGEDGSYANVDNILTDSDCDIRNEDRKGNVHCIKFIPIPVEPKRIYQKKLQ